MCLTEIINHTYPTNLMKIKLICIYFIKVLFGRKSYIIHMLIKHNLIFIRKNYNLFIKIRRFPITNLSPLF